MKQKLIELIKSMKSEKHYENTEDNWYSCPKAPDGCSDDHAGKDCNCGVDKLNKTIDEVLALLEGDKE